MNASLRRLALPLVLFGLATTANAAPAAAVSPTPVLERGQEAANAYAEGRYADAAQSFDAIAKTEGVSAPLYYNLGAAQLEAGELGPAILSLERARWLAPHDRGIAHALRSARERAGLPSNDAPSWRVARSIADPDTWATIALVTLVATSLCVSLLLVEPDLRLARPRVRRVLGVGTGVAAACLVVALLACASLALETSRAVALEPDLALRVAPFDAADSRGSLGAGEVVRVEARHGEFVLVNAGGGRSGWVPAREIGAVVPG
jgi:hypothetical protein